MIYPGTPQKQHLVSQVLLRRFVEPSTSMVSCVDLRSGKAFLKSPSAVCYEIGFIKDDAIGAEQRWKTIEDNAPSILAALDDETFFDRPEHANQVRELLALHYARSATVAVIDRTARPRAVAAVRAQLVNEYPHQFAEEFYLRHGIVPAGREALMHAAEEVLPRNDEVLDRFFTERVYENFAEAMKRLAAHEIQIAVATDEAEFVIGDVPALTMRPDRLVGGPLGGIPWDEAITVALPLGPRHLAGIGKTTAWIPVGRAEVERLNAVQVRSAVNRVICRPGSDLEPWIVATRLSTTTIVGDTQAQ